MPGKRSCFTFLQVSDVHLDSKLSSMRLSMPPIKRQERKKEILEVLVDALELARKRAVDAVLIPGDLWDGESVTSQTVNTLVETFGALGDIPVLISPGNHDYYSDGSLYSPSALMTRGMRPWPANVHIFPKGEFTTFKHPKLNSVSFTGRAFSGNVSVSSRFMSKFVPQDPTCAVNLLLFHGSLDGYKGLDSSWPGKITAPFSQAELSDLNFSYAAIGHYHNLTEIHNDQGSIIGAYSGCPAGRGFDESGPRYVLIGTIEFADDFSPRVVSLEKVEVDKRRFVVVELDITGLTVLEAGNEAKQKLIQAGAREGSDIVCLKIRGRHPIGGEPSEVCENIANKYYHWVIEDASRPGYSLDRFDERTTEGKFIQTLLALKEKLDEAGGGLPLGNDQSELTLEIVEDALYFGLDALKQKKVTVRHVD